jgi:hypothetical protein
VKFLLLASFVVFCTASTVYRNRNISVNDDGSILITSPTGRRVVISRPTGPSGQGNLDISVAGPNIPTKRIQINDNALYTPGTGEGPWSSVDSLSEEWRSKRGSLKGRTQGDILDEILREYQGVVDEAQYEKLLNRINKAVRNGVVSPQIYDLLAGLDQITNQQEGIVSGQSGQGILYGQYQGQGPYQGQGSYQGLYQGQGPYQGLYQGQGPYQGLYQGQGPYQGQYQQYQQGYGPVYGQSYGPVGYGYGATALLTGTSLPWWAVRGIPQSQSVVLSSSQIPAILSGAGSYGSLYNLGRQYYPTSLNVNPLLGRILGASQRNYLNGLLANQQLNGGVQTVLGSQIYGGVPSLSGVGGSNALLRLIGSQQVPYVQGQVSVGVPQTVAQLNAIQQQQQIEQLNEVQQAIEQNIEQLNEIQQEQQQIGQFGGVQQQIAQLNGVQQAIAQLNNVEQAIEQLNEVQQQQQQIAQLSGVQQGITQQLGGVPQQLRGVQTIGQLRGVQTIGQLRGVPQYTVGQYGIPRTIQQLLGIPQTVGPVSGINAYSSSLPLYRGYPTRQPVVLQGTTGGYLNNLQVPQVQLAY